MPNVINFATEVKQSDGSSITQFTDVTSTATQTYTYPKAQNRVMIANLGSSDIKATVGSQSNIVIAPGTETTFTATSVTSFTISSTINSQAFRATSFVFVPTDLSLLAVKTEVAATYETKANASATYGKVKTVNNIAPDAAGNVTIA